MKKLLCILLLIGLFVCSMSMTGKADWIHITTDVEKTNWFFDTQTQKKTSNISYSVWVKRELTEEEGQKLAKKLNYKTTVSYVLTKEEVNFLNKTMRLMLIADYDKNDNVLSSEERPSRWNVIQPNSIGETIFNATHDYYKKHN